MMSSNISTRSRDARKHLFCEGIPCELPTVEPNTYREIIHFYYHLQNIFDDYDNLKLSQMISVEVFKVWRKVNANLPLISNKGIENKILNILDLVKGINWKRVKKEKKNNLVEKLDQVFDISSCVCSLDEVPCNDRRIHCKIPKCKESHIICSCPTENNVPVCERRYLKDQRNRNGNKGKYQMSSSQRVPTRSSSRRIKSPAKVENYQIDLTFNDNLGDQNWEPEKRPSGKYNIAKLKCTGAELVRYGISSQAGAAIVNALLHDYQHLFKTDFNIAQFYVDKSKMDRAKSQAFQEWGTSKDHSDITCLGIDGKVDTKTCEYEKIMIDGEELLKKVVTPQHHLTFTNETKKNPYTYLTHRTIPLKGATGSLMACQTQEVLEEYKSTKSLVAVLVDNTSVNTGQENGLVHQLELLLGRRLQMIGCGLHQNELPLRSIFRKLDGVSTGPNAFGGILGKRCSNDLQKEPLRRFKKIKILFPGFDPHNVHEDLSSDQSLLLEYVKAISKGSMDHRIACRNIGPLNHARWLTLSIRLLALYTRSIEPSECLVKLVNFIMSAYAPAWFSIKMSSSLKDAPLILFNTISAIRTLPYKDLKEMVYENLQGNAYCLLPENMLYSMMLSEDQSVRIKGWDAVLKLRQTEVPYGRKVPRINWDAAAWHELIDFSNLSCYNEPATVNQFKSHEIKRFMKTGKKVELFPLPAHSQSVERSVKMVSEASRQRYGLESRHESILVKMASRVRRPDFPSKGSYENYYFGSEYANDQ